MECLAGWQTLLASCIEALKNLYGRDFGTSLELYEVSPGWFNDDFVEKDDQDSVVGTATPYGLGVSRLEPVGGQFYRSPSKRPSGTLCFLWNGCQFSFLRIKLLRRGVDHQPPSSAEVKEWVELYLSASLCAFSDMLRVKFTLTFASFYTIEENNL
jgi:hypothetical protein